MFKLQGTIEKNKGRGKELGYPTANIKVSENAPEGIFIAQSTVNSIQYPSLLFIGPSITFDETDKKAEVYILDFAKDIYGKNITVEVIKKIRDNVKFDSQEELVAQMEQDEKDARAFFDTQR